MLKKISTIIKDLIIILLLGIILMYILGFRYLFVLTGSMRPTFDINTLVVTKPTALKDLKKKDIITINVNGNQEIKLTHRIIKIDYDNQLIYTKGDNNPTADNTPTKYKDVVGKVIFYIPYVGKIFSFFKTITGIIILAGISIIIIIDAIKRKN